MKIQILVIIILYLFKEINGITSNTIKIKFKTFKFLDENNSLINWERGMKSSYKEKYIYYDLILNNIYSEILIGSPPRKIIGFYSGKSEHFSIIHDKCFIETSKYDRTESNTFRNISEFKINFKKYKNGCFAKENFKFESYDDRKEIIFKDLKFYLADDYKLNDEKNKIENTCAIIGLRLNYQDMFIENPKNFIYYLMQYFNNIKKLNNDYILNSYYWTINFDNNDINTGYISIGEPPHIYDYENHKKEKFYEFNMQAKYSTMNWVIQFKDIFIKSKKDINENKFDIFYLKKYSDAHNCIFYPELNIILSTNDYFNYIKIEFFRKFVEKRICFLEKVLISEFNSTIIEGLNGMYSIFYCDKNKILEYDINKFYGEFPSLNFYHSYLNFTFYFNATDLFYLNNNQNKLYFLIGNKNNEVDQWIFGKTFMKKYQFIFNSEMKTLGFYILNDNDNNRDIGKNYIGIIILIIIIFVIFFMLMAYKYKNFLVKKKNIIANEMELIQR